MARLSHPNLVRLLDRGEDAEGPYLVMELVDGREPEEPRPPRGGAATRRRPRASAREVGEALALRARARAWCTATSRPRTCCSPRDGGVKLADFGIARLIEAEGERGPHAHRHAPGQRRLPLARAGRRAPGRRAHRHLLARASCSTSASPAALPFRGEGFVAVAMKHCSEPLPDPRLARPACPTGSPPCAMRAAAKEPADRYPDADRDGRRARGADRGTAVCTAAAVPAGVDEGDTAQRRRRPAAAPGWRGRLRSWCCCRGRGRRRSCLRPRRRAQPPPARRGRARSPSRRCATTTRRATTRPSSPACARASRADGRPDHRLVHRALPRLPGVRRPEDAAWG